MSKTQRTDGGRRRQKKKEKTGVRILKGILTCFLVAFFVLGILVVKRVAIPVVSMYREAVELVEASDASTFKSEQTSIIYDVNGEEIKKLKGEKDVYYLDYDSIPDAAKLAVISVEDKNFTTHRGIDIEGIARAVVALIRNKGEITMGGSTITQQLARNVFLTHKVTYSRKIEEIFIAIALEQKYTKQEILEFYLNNVYFANSCYGIEAASQTYFGKTASDLTIAQVAFLCAIPNSPTRYDPYVDPDATLTRRNKILKNMYEDGYITKTQYEKSFSEDVSIQAKKENKSNDYAETYIIKCATESLMANQGFTFQYTFDTDEEEEAYEESYEELYNTCRQSLYSAGYRIYTSIDMDLQNEMQQAVSTNLSSFTEKTDDGVYKVQGAGVCIDNETGRVAAIVGGREKDQEGYGLNRAYQNYRQPGSAIKPLLVYTPALEMGYTQYSTLDDSRMEDGEVSNAGYTYLGSITLKRAVQRSSNVATYRLYQELGPERCMKYLEKLHFKGLEPEDYKYDTTCIGGFTKGTTPVEMAAGYAAIANDGEYREPTCIVKILDSDKNVIVADEQKSEDVYSSSAARQMTEILESCVTSSEGTASGCGLDVDMPVACKTGTTSDYVDGWLCGYSPYYTTAVWVGMDVYQSVDNLKGNTYPAYIWKSFMDMAHQNLTRKEFSYYIGDEDEEDEDTTRATTEEEEEEIDVYEDEDYETDDEDSWEDEEDDWQNQDATTQQENSGSGTDASGDYDTGSGSGTTEYDSGSDTENDSGSGYDDFDGDSSGGDSGSSDGEDVLQGGIE